MSVQMLGRIVNNIESKIVNYLSTVLEIDPERISTTSRFSEMGMDSLDIVECIMDMEDVFDVLISDDEIPSILSVDGLSNSIASALSINTSTEDYLDKDTFGSD